MQTIEALNHLKRKFSMRSARVAITDYDRKAFNRLIEHYNATAKQNSNNQAMFKKLFINEFLRQSVFHNKGTRLALTNIEELLRIPLDNYYATVSEEAKFKRMQDRLIELEYTEDADLSKDIVERQIQIDHNNRVISANFQQLREDLLNGYTKEQARRFLENHLNELILTYKDFT